MQKRAGSLVVNRNKELLLIFRKGKWDLPKGRVKKHEKKRHGALRETAEEMLEFIDGLPLHILKEAAKFFTNIPTLIHKIEYKCVKCETKNEILVNGYDHFFG